VSEAHPSVTPLDFRVEKPPAGWDEPSIRMYDLVRRRALAALSPRPVIEECRRVLAAGGVLVALGWRRILEEGWRAILPEQPMPEPAVPDNAPGLGHPADEPVSDLRITGVAVEQPGIAIGMAELVELMRREGIGRPSTYARTIGLLLEKGWVELDGGAVRLTARGAGVLSRLSGIEPVLGVAFAREFEARLDAVESGRLSSDEAIRSLGSALPDDVAAKLGWLDHAGDAVAGEPAPAAYARRDREPPAAPAIRITVEDPETTLARDDPVRLARNRLHAAFLVAHGPGWWRLTPAERRCYKVEALLDVARIDPAAWEQRLRYDALLRWCLDLTAEPPARHDRQYRLWLLGLEEHVRDEIRAAAEKVALALGIGRFP